MSGRQVNAPEAVTQNAGEPTPKLQRRRRASTGGHALKLDAPQRDGYVRRWVNGDPLRVQGMEELGYTRVNDPAATDSARTDGLGTRITRHAGLNAKGEPYQAILMETPDDLYMEGVIEKEDGRKPFEEAIRRSADTQGELTKEGLAHQPRTRSSINHSG